MASRVNPDNVVIYNDAASLALDVREQLANVRDDLESLSSVKELTSVAGNGSAYTATFPVQSPSTNVMCWFKPNTDNTGACTLAAENIGGGSAYPVYTMDRANVAANQLVSDARYLLFFTGSEYYLVGMWRNPRINTRFRMVGSGASIDFIDSDDDAAGRVRLFQSSGRLLGYTGGDGATIGDLQFAVEADGDFRTYKKFMDARNQQVFSPANPGAFNETTNERLSYFNLPWWEIPNEPVHIDSTEPYSVSGANLGKHIRVSVASAWIDFEAMPLNSHIIVDVQSGASATLYSGYTGFTWRSFGGTRLNAPANAMVMVIKGQTDITAFAFNGTLTAVTPTVPTYNRKIAFFPAQSWGERETKNAYYGIQARLEALGLDRSVLVVQDVAAGASALMYGAPTDPTNYWWDTASGTPSNVANPSTNTSDALAAVAAAPASPDLTDCIVMYGLNDLSIFNESGGTTPASWTAAQLALQAYIRTQLSLPNLRFWICPLPSQDLGTFDENKWYAMRRAHLDVVDQDANSYRGPDYYDLPRPYGDRHHTYLGQAEHGARLINFITNETDAKTNYLGPKITNFARTAANTYVVTISYVPGLSIQRPTAPVGFAIVPDGDLFATPLEVEPGGYIWGTSGSDVTLTITTTTDNVNADLCYPYGSAYEMLDLSRIVRALDPVHNVWMPLQTYHPDV